MSAVTIPNLRQLQEVTAIQISIVSPETRREAEDYLVKIDKASRQLTADIKALKQPHQDEIAKIDAATKSWKELLASRAETIKQAILAYNNKMKAAVQAANAKAMEKFEVKVEKAIEKAVSTGTAIKLVVPPQLKDEPKKTEVVEGAKMTTMKIKKWRLRGAASTLDPKELTAQQNADLQLNIPLKHFHLDTAGIGKIIKSGGDVPGVEVYEDETIAIRHESHA